MFPCKQIGILCTTSNQVECSEVSKKKKSQFGDHEKAEEDI